MRYLLRRTSASIWEGENRDRTRAIGELTRTEADTDGLSVFAVHNDEERALIVAAIACERGRTDRVDLLEIDEASLAVFGAITATPDAGTTAVPRANALHCSLDWDAAALRALADTLFDDPEMKPRRYAKAEVQAALNQLVEEDVEGEKARLLVRSVKSGR